MEFFTKYRRGVNPSVRFTHPTLTEQHHKDDCDINKILDRYARVGAGALEGVAIRNGQYLDVTGAPMSAHEMYTRTAEMRQNFELLPAKTREFFRNSPENMYDWLADPANADQAVEMGLLRESDIIRRPKAEEGRDSSLLDRTVTTDTEGEAAGGKDGKNDNE